MITTISSLKGGSGKSTLTFNLAIWLANAGQNVLALDLDPQQTLTDVIGVRREEGYEPDIVIGKKSWLKQPEKLAAYDEILIDTGTADMDSLKQALKVADRIIIPVLPSQADIWSVQRFIKIIHDSIGDKSTPLLAFINRGDTHFAIRESDEAAAALMALKSIQFIKTRLAHRTAFRRSFSEGLAVFEMDPRSKAAQEWLALVAQLYKELIT